MDSIDRNSRGFTLIASLLLLCLLSAICIGLLMMVNTEGRAGGDDLQNTMAYRSAEGAIEKMTSDLANSFASSTPSPATITGLSSLVPSGDPSVSYPDYSFSPATTPGGALNANYSEIQTGPYQGLYAQTVPITLKATALRSLGQEVTMVRTVEMALVPVFQFGVFSDSDLSFFAGVDLDFQGRVHTNGDLFLSAGTGDTATFHDKISVFGNVIRTMQPNGLTNTATAHLGTINVLTIAQGCDGAQPGCRSMLATEGSVVGAGGNPAQSAYNSGPPSWQTTSQSSYNGWIINGNYGNPVNTGAKQLTLPFFNSSGASTSAQPQQYEIVRRPPPGEVATGTLGAARLYNQAEIRVMLTDDPAELPGGAGDANNVRLANGQFNASPDYTRGVRAGTPVLAALASGQLRTTYFAEASTAIPDPNPTGPFPATLPADWQAAPLTANLDLLPATPLRAPLLSTGATLPTAANISMLCGALGTTTNPACAYPYYAPTAAANTSKWNLIDGYLRVEALESGAWVGVTQEWLDLGFARGIVPPATPGTNPINPNAILILQEPADRNGNGGAPDSTGTATVCTKSALTGKYTSCTYGEPPEVQNDANTNSPYYGDFGQATSVSRNNWYPINFYDAREGEVRDNKAGNNSCTPNGVMNAVEIDVGNLKRWLAGTTGTTGPSVNYTDQNGYILYFSDRRGMLVNPNGTFVTGFAAAKTGDSGLEDSINSSTAAGTPDNALEPIPAGKSESPEDVNNNLRLDNFGIANLGNGFGINTSGGTEYARITSCLATGRANWVSGARHVLKLVDGSLGNVPTQPGGTGGFTVASENPVYILGDYNSSAADPMWSNPTTGIEPAHAAAGIIADSVTALSDNWTDLESMTSPSDATGRPAVTTYYRAAVAAGKNINFPVAGLAWQNGDWGTDGGVHNFLRLLETWGGQTLNYKGSLVNLYYSTYATGTDKNAGGTVYGPPTRNYIFDPLFSQPQNLPPGTPMFRDVDNLSYQQSFTPRSD
ncbi:MAG TPA: hypothetical protein VH079_11780 [Terriglobales bacterium]|nr:hypothetical protein [Terriglobales bacterium]